MLYTNVKNDTSINKKGIFMIKEKYVNLVDTFEINTSNVKNIDNILLDKIVEESKKSANKYGIGNVLQITKDQAKLDQGFFASAEDCVSYINTQYKNKYYKYVVVPRKQGIYTIISLYEVGLSQNQIAINMASPELRTYVAEDAFGNFEKKVHAPGFFQKGPNKKKVADEQSYYNILVKVIVEGIGNAKIDIESGNLNVPSNKVVTQPVANINTSTIEKPNNGEESIINEIDETNISSSKSIEISSNHLEELDWDRWEEIPIDIQETIINGTYALKMFSLMHNFDFENALEEKKSYLKQFKMVGRMDLVSTYAKLLKTISNNFEESNRALYYSAVTIAFCEESINSNDYTSMFGFKNMYNAIDKDNLITEKNKVYIKPIICSKELGKIAHEYIYNYFSFIIDLKRLKQLLDYSYSEIKQGRVNVFVEKSDTDINTRIESYKDSLAQIQEGLQSDGYKNEEINYMEQNNDKIINDNTLKYYVNEDGEKFIFEIELPGIEKEEIDVDYVDDYITVSINSNDNEVKSNIAKNIYGHSMKHYVGKVIEKKIDANLKNGILILVVPKKIKIKKTKIVVK